MNNLNSSSHTNVKTVIQDFVRENEQCVLERFTEGVLEAVIGDSADEGYSTGLRKLYMVVLSWRRNKASAHFNIKRFFSSINKCLINNPLGMHFHISMQGS